MLKRFPAWVSGSVRAQSGRASHARGLEPQRPGSNVALDTALTSSLRGMRLCLRLLCFGVRSAAPIRRSDWQECEGHAQGNRATPLPSWCYVSCSVGSIRSSDRLSACRGGSQQACASNLASSKLGNNCARLRVMIVYFCSFSSFKLPTGAVGRHPFELP